jgi:transposase
LQVAGLFFALEDDALGAGSTTYVGGADMADGIRWVGLDVHARQSTVAVFDQATGEVLTRRVMGRAHELLPVLREIPRPARMVYEAGPTDGLVRRALAEGIELSVCAPSKTERPAADRIKTDTRDAIRLARLLAAGELTLVTIPSVEREQLRDLVRCREDIRHDLTRARHRIGGFLLRREIYWEGPGEAWTRKHRSWLTSVRFADHASQATLADYLHAHGVLIARRDQVEAVEVAGPRQPNVRCVAHRGGCSQHEGARRPSHRTAGRACAVLPRRDRPA